MKHNFEISYTQQGDYLLPDLRLEYGANGIYATSSSTTKSGLTIDIEA